MDPTLTEAALPFMDRPFYEGFVVLTPWKIVGYLGVLFFGSRWIVQLWASTIAKKPTFPVTFWLLSLAGSVMTLTYFIWGKNDSVGILGNLFPAFIAAYNLFLELTDRKRRPDAVRADAAPEKS